MVVSTGGLEFRWTSVITCVKDGCEPACIAQGFVSGIHTAFQTKVGGGVGGVGGRVVSCLVFIAVSAVKVVE